MIMKVVKGCSSAMCYPRLGLKQVGQWREVVNKLH